MNENNVYLCLLILTLSVMKKQTRTIIIVLLNVLFCAYMLWFSARNTYLRPYAGSTTRELLAGLILLITLYANYFLLYPKLHKKHPVVYWVVLVSLCIIAAAMDFAIAYHHIMYCNGAIIGEIGAFRFFSHYFKLLTIRNVALNTFPFIFRERQELQKALDKEVQIVYQDARLVDVADNDHNMRLISKDDIFYCQQDGNYTRIYVTQDDPYYSRNGSMKYLEQLFGPKEFVRVSNTLLIPYRYIQSCNGTEVFMKRLPWQNEPLSFAIEPKYLDQAPGQIALHLLTAKGLESMKPPKQNRKRRKPKPSQEKTDTVLQYIKEHPGNQTKEIAENTQFSPTTVERCLAELRKQGLVKYKGSKKSGGYCVVDDSMESMAEETAQGQGKIAGKKVLKEKSAKKKLTEGKPAEPSSKE